MGVEAWKSLGRNEFRVSLKEHWTGVKLVLNCYIVMLNFKNTTDICFLFVIFCMGREPRQRI